MALWLVPHPQPIQQWAEHGLPRLGRGWGGGMAMFICCMGVLAGWMPGLAGVGVLVSLDVCLCGHMVCIAASALSGQPGVQMMNSNWSVF